MTARPAAPLCGDLVRIGVAVDGDRVADAGFEAAGCGAALAAGSAAVELVRGRAASSTPRAWARTRSPTRSAA